MYEKHDKSHRHAFLSAASVVVMCLLMLIAMAVSARAAHDDALSAAPALTGERQATNLQLVVLEAPGCSYCNLFRRYVVPAYETSPRARDVPIKIIDLNDAAYDKLGLDGPVDTVPTTVLMQNNREVGRIPGYLGPENFFHAVNHLMARTN